MHLWYDFHWLSNRASKSAQIWLSLPKIIQIFLTFFHWKIHFWENFSNWHFLSISETNGSLFLMSPLKVAKSQNQINIVLELMFEWEATQNCPQNSTIEVTLDIENVCLQILKLWKKLNATALKFWTHCVRKSAWQSQCTCL